MTERNFKVGDRVIVRDGLRVGEIYYNIDGTGDVFMSEMKESIGKTGVITKIDYRGYRLDIGEYFTYTDEMLRPTWTPRIVQ